MTPTDDREPGARVLCFPPFRLDLATEQLWRGPRQLAVRPKTLAVLRYLIEHPGRLVTREELCQAVWPQTVGSERAPKQCIRELRQVLGETTATPHFIETLTRRGWRFAGTVISSPQAGASSQDEERQKAKGKTQKAKIEDCSSASSSQPPVSTVVGRGAELGKLHDWLEHGLNGTRQMVFVTGEPGIGKTSLVEAFLEGSRHGVLGSGSSLPQLPNPKAQSPEPQAWVAVGQCIEQHGAGEAFLPVLDALGRLANGTAGARLIELLRTYAPMWLVQLPAFIDGEEVETLQRKVQGATRERMLRELAEVLEQLTAEHPVILVLEDLHWSDVSTLNLLAFLARRKEAARLLVLGTYRPVEMLNDGHPLQGITQELYAHGLATELPLGLLSEVDIAAYMHKRFPVEAHGHAPLRSLARPLHQHTGGNPLFLVSTVDELVAQGILTQTDHSWSLQGEITDVGITDSIRHLVVRQSGRLSADERQALEAASVAGMEFSTAAVAAALTLETVEIERRCEQLAERQHFLRRVGVDAWPDGTLAARYGFLHGLYQHLWHEHVSPMQLQHYHVQIGERKESAYGARAGEIAAELAVHFEQGRDFRKAVNYLHQAGENALRRSAHQTAISLFSREWELLQALPDTPERIQQELQVCTLLGPTLMTLKGYAAPEVEQTYTRAFVLCRQIGETPRQFAVLLGFAFFYLARGQLQEARQLGEQCLSLAQQDNKALRLLQAHVILANSLFYQGELRQADEHLQAGLTLYNTMQPHVPLHTLHDPGINALSSLRGFVLWCLGYPDRAVHSTEEALAVATHREHPLSQAIAAVFASGVQTLCRNARGTGQYAEQAVSLATEQEFALWRAYGMIMRGWALGQHADTSEGIAEIQRGLAITRALGAELVHSWFLSMLAETYEKAGLLGEALATIGEALDGAQQRGEQVFAAELHRLKGELTLAPENSKQRAGGKRSEESGGRGEEQNSEIPNTQHPAPSTHAEAYFLKAIDIARKQSAKSWELRATVSLARLWQRQGKRHEAHKILSKIYNWFTEGFDTADLKEAKALIEELSPCVIERCSH